LGVDATDARADTDAHFFFGDLGGTVDPRHFDRFVHGRSGVMNEGI